MNLSGSQMENAKIESLKNDERQAFLLVSSAAADLLEAEEAVLHAKDALKLALCELADVREKLRELQTRAAGPF